jgi:malate synthase
MSAPLTPVTRSDLALPAGLALVAETPASAASILTTEALAFCARLESEFGARRLELLDQRERAQEELDAGRLPDFLEETIDVRTSDWRISPVSADIRDRRVEITGPVDRKMIINALNSGAKVFMADFEDSSSPTWTNMVEGQQNLFDAVRGTIAFDDPASGKHYELGPDPAVLFVRPRGWHLVEKHVVFEGEPMSASLFDFGLFVFHNAKKLISQRTAPYFYLPKIENHLEARLWNDVFDFAQDELEIKRGTIKATVLIETVLAAFEMDEILYELREHSAGLNCGRWDYIFSFIKRFRARADFVLPDRASIGMDRRFLSAYSQLLVKTCHRRGAHAMGGMAAQIPIKDDLDRNAAALKRVREDKVREAKNGHDGTWVAHPGLIAIARDVFDAAMPESNQLAKIRADVEVTAEDLLAVPDGAITEAGLRQNLSVGVLYLEAWLRGSGCVPIRDLMEDAATAEISRAQVWQWIRHGARLDDGRAIDAELVRATLVEELTSIRESLGDDAYTAGRFELAASLFERLTTAEELEEFLTLAAYEHI